MSIFTKPKGIEETADILGGSSTWDTGVYEVIVEGAYLDQSPGGAYNMNFTFKTIDGNTLSNTQYVTSGTAKGGRNYYERDGKKYNLPGFIVADDVCFAATGKSLDELTPEDKVVEVYDFTAKKKLPATKKVFMDMIGKPVMIGVQKVKEFKNVKNDAGEYVPGDEVKIFNEVVKVFGVNRHTSVEARAGKDAEFIDKWIERNPSDYIKDKTKGVTPKVTSGGAAPDKVAPLFKK